MTIIREAVVTDIPALARMYKAAGWGWFGNDIDLYVCLSRGYVKMLVADEAGVGIVGFIALDLSEYWGKRAVIEDWYVVPGRRGTLVGKKLVAVAWRRLELGDWRRVTAYVREDNAPMKGLMARLGWALVASLRNYDPEGNTYLMFVRRVPEGYMRRRNNET